MWGARKERNSLGRPLGDRPVLSVLNSGRNVQPRPQFGRLPWFAFFFVRSFRLTVRFDMVWRA